MRADDFYPLYSPFSNLTGSYKKPNTHPPIQEKNHSVADHLIPYIDKSTIDKAISWLSKHLQSQNLVDSNTLFLYNLKGAQFFFDELQMKLPGIKGQAIRVSRSVANSQDFGDVKTSNILWPAAETWQGIKTIIILEDIADKDETLKFILDLIKKTAGPEMRVLTVALFDKIVKKHHEGLLDIALLAIQDRFVVGFGLDENNDRYRQEPLLYEYSRKPMQ